MHGHLRSHKNRSTRADRKRVLRRYGPIRCAVCGESVGKQMPRGHLRVHNLTMQEYRSSYPDEPVYAGRGGGHQIGVPAWNKGLTKNTDQRVAKFGRTLSRRLANGEVKPSFLGQKHSQETLAKLKKAGGYRPGAGHGKKSRYLSPTAGAVHLDSSWELEIAKLLDKLEFRWERPTTPRATWLDSSDVQHRYFPDFFLSDHGFYLEPKGWQHEGTSMKMSQVKNQIRVVVLHKKEFLETVALKSGHLEYWQSLI